MAWRYCLAPLLLLSATCTTVGLAKPTHEVKATTQAQLHNTQQPIAKELIIEKDRIYNPEILSLDSVKYYSQKFNFDWNDIRTLAANKSYIATVEQFLATKPVIGQLNADDKEAFARMLYKLGTYYTHITRESERAVPILTQALPLLRNATDKAWTQNHLAYAFEQMYAQTKHPVDHQQAIRYMTQVMQADLHSQAKAIAFAYRTQGLLQRDDKQYTKAEDSLKTALRLHAAHDTQYARTKHCLSEVLLTMDHHDLEAVNALQAVDHYWRDQPLYNQNPYAAHNLVVLGKGYIKVTQYTEAASALEHSIKIYQHVYGERSRMLAEPYELLAQVYQKLNNTKLAAVSRKKARGCVA